jgi:transporter family protein
VTPFIWALLAALCWGIAPLFEKIGLRGSIDPSVAVFVRSLGVMLGALGFLPFWSKVGPEIAALPMRGWVYIILGGIFASIFGQICFYRALKLGEMSRVVPIGASYPLIAFILGITVMKEPLTAGKTLGVMLVMTGLYLLR